MAMLDDILKQSQPGVNPQLEDMVAKMLSGSGMAGPQASAAAQGMGPAALGAPPAPGGAPGMPAGGGGMAGPEGNETFRVLVSRGVPPEMAKQALTNPEMLRQILAQLFKGQQGAPSEPQMAPSKNPQSAPPLGGGGGYG
jgi:hypothetical protein